MGRFDDLINIDEEKNKPQSQAPSPILKKSSPDEKNKGLKGSTFLPSFESKTSSELKDEIKKPSKKNKNGIMTPRYHDTINGTTTPSNHDTANIDDDICETV